MVPISRKLLDLLSNKDVTFFIPPYQRNYEWSKDQCEAFWIDILKTAKRNANDECLGHFFGTFTFFQEKTPIGYPDKIILVDGQQRITTTMLFLAALRDSLDDKQIRNFIETRFLKNNDTIGPEEYKIKLKQVEIDWETYKNIILNKEISEVLTEIPVYKNYKWFLSELNKYKQDGNSLADLYEKGLENFNVVTIELELDKHENPQEIFESMNSLGKPLSFADLVRNYLLLGFNAEEQAKYYNEYWLQVEKNVPGKVSTFIKDYMQLYLGRALPKASEGNYKKLYNIFKTNCNKEAEEFLKDFKKYSSIYACLISEKSTGEKKVDAVLNDLKYLNLTPLCSFLLGILFAMKENKITAEDTYEVLNVFKTYCCRRRLISGISTTETASFAILTKRIPEILEAKDKKQKTFELLANQGMKARIPNDIEVRKILETIDFYNFGYSKLYLAFIEEKLTKSRPDISDPKLQKEHIMPQTLTETWKKNLGNNYAEIYQNYINTIGNITLIRHNPELSNNSFLAKRKIYEENSGLQIAKTKITNCTQWNEKTIKDRADWIINYLLEVVFPIPENMRKINNFNPERKGKGLSFLDLQLIGETINFIKDPSITAVVTGNKTVEFEGKQWKLSQLTREIETRKGTVNNSGSYQGAAYWEYDGIKLSEIM